MVEQDANYSRVRMGFTKLSLSVWSVIQAVPHAVVVQTLTVTHATSGGTSTQRAEPALTVSQWLATT